MSSGGTSQGGGVPLAARVSRALRTAELPVLYAAGSENDRGRTGIRVRQSGADSCMVSVSVFANEFSNERDGDAELEWSNLAYGVLVAQGYNARRQQGHSSIFVYGRKGSEPAAPEDVHAVAAASGLDIYQPSPTEWHVDVGGKRGAYVIRRTGKDARTRYAVHRRFDELQRSIRTMGEALEVIKRDIEARSK